LGKKFERLFFDEDVALSYSKYIKVTSSNDIHLEISTPFDLMDGLYSVTKGCPPYNCITTLQVTKGQIISLADIESKSRLIAHANDKRNITIKTIGSKKPDLYIYSKNRENRDYCNLMCVNMLILMGWNTMLVVEQ